MKKGNLVKVNLYLLSVLLILTAVSTSYSIPARKNTNKVVVKTKYVNVPHGARIIKFNKINYRFHNGIFYRPSGNRFVVAAAPIGITVSTLPRAYRKVFKNGRPYYFYGGNYFLRVRGGFRVVLL